MSKAGGIVGLLAGIFGFFAAIITLFIGGVGAAFNADKAHTIVGLGWGGILFSFLAIVFAAVALAKPKPGGYGLIAAAVLGAFLGGTFVAVCMALAVVGGILAVVGAPKTSTKVVVEESVRSLLPSGGVASEPVKVKRWPVVVGGLVAVLAVIAIIGVGSQPKSAVNDPLVQLEGEAVSELEPFGELSEMFALGSSNTKLQRENKLKEITGKVVHWDLPVYEVARAENGYKIQTETGDLVGTFVMISPRSEEERKLIGGLKTGDQLSFKGRIAGSSLRSLNIEPAILVAGKNGLGTGASAQSRMIAGIAQLQAQMAARTTSEQTTQVAPVASITPVAAAVPVVAITPVTVVPLQTAMPNSLASTSSSDNFAPSYDCQKASTGSERLICSSRELSALDVELSQAYGRRLDGATDKISLKTEQVKWRKNVRDACSTGECMAKAYRERIEDFVAQSQYLSKPAQFR